MNLPLRIVLLAISVITLIFIIRSIRKSQMQIQDSIFWICFFAFILLLGIFPSVGIAAASLLGIESAANLVFLIIIFVLLIKCYFLSVQISGLESKIKKLAQKYALEKNEKDSP